MGTDAPSLERKNVSEIFVHTGFWQIDRTLRFVGLWLPFSLLIALLC